MTIKRFTGSRSRSIAVFNRSRAMVIFGIFALSALAWVHMGYLGWHAVAHSDALRPSAHHPTNLILIFLMWSVMMVAMMIPSAAPTILMFDTIIRKKSEHTALVSPTLLFVSGYLATWMVYSGMAAVLQLWLQNAALITTSTVKSVPVISGCLLIIAGLFQFSHLKYACLKHCQSPMGFFMLHWKDGPRGAFLMGLRSGLYCVGCCWALMVLMFVAGAMNIIWMVLLAIYILAEKMIPGGRRFSRISGMIMIGWGLWMLAPL